MNFILTIGMILSSAAMLVGTIFLAQFNIDYAKKNQINDLDNTQIAYLKGFFTMVGTLGLIAGFILLIVLIANRTCVC